MTPAILALAALHVVNVTFVSLRAGVSAGDHLVPAAVELALLAAAFAASRHARAGVRGAIALLLAPLLLTAGGLAVADASARGLSGEDATGLLLLPAGVALLATGALTLWRGRRPGGRVVVRRALLALSGLVVAVEVLVPVALGYVATHRPRDPLARLDLGAPATAVTLRTSDGLRLAASYVPSRNGAAIVLFPSRSGTQAHARMLVARGYGVLAVDMRGYGASQGDPNAYGWGATRDIDAAVAWLRAQHGIRAGGVGGLGLSVGGEQMLDAAAGNPALAAVVSDGAGERSVRETLARGETLAVPLQAVLTATVALFSGQSPPAALPDVAGRIAPRAAFFIYAEHGQGGEERLTPDAFRDARAPRLLWRVPGAGHTGGLRARPRAYARRVVAFFDAHLHRNP